MGFSGVYGDRLFAFKVRLHPRGIPLPDGREQEEMSARSGGGDMDACAGGGNLPPSRVDAENTLPNSQRSALPLPLRSEWSNR